MSKNPTSNVRLRVDHRSLAAVGGVLFGFDTSTMNAAINGISPTIRLSSGSVGFVAVVALISCAVGAWFAGLVAARIRRKRDAPGGWTDRARIGDRGGRQPRAKTLGTTRGLLKAVVDREADRILGVAILAAQGGEVAAVVQTAMLGGLPASTLPDAVLAHPTMTKGLNQLFASWTN
jgi:MFS family permease